MQKPDQDPAEGSRKVIDRELARAPAAQDGPENRAAADKATQDNDLTTGHSQDGDGGDANSKDKP